MSPGLVAAAWAMWGASAAACLWKATQLVRAPRDPGLRLVFVCTLLVLLGLTAQLAVVAGGVLPLPAGTPKVLQNFVVVWFFATFLSLMSSLVRPLSRVGRAWFEIALATAVTVAFVGIVVAAPTSDVDWEFQTAGGDPWVLAFYLLINAYMCYACARGIRLCLRAAPPGGGHLGVSLRIAAAGLAINCVFVHLYRTLSATAHLAGVAVPRQLDVLSGVLLGIGIVVFFLGILYPGLRTGVLKALARARDQLRFRTLRPLWAALVDRFPEIALYPPRGQLRDDLALVAFRRHYYRRLVECRDGLLLVSPFIAGSLRTTSGRALPLEDQARLVRDALVRLDRGEDAADSPVVVAAPEHHTMEADARELVGLAHHFARLGARPQVSSSAPTADADA